MDAEELRGIAMSRRSALKKGAATAFLLSQAALFEQLALAPVRPASAATTFSDIQFDMGAFINPAQVFNDGAGSVTAQFAPTYALLQPVTLNRTPTKADQTTLANALTTIEASYPASPSGVLIFSVSYGVPYFNRLPQSVVQANMPRTVGYAGLAAGRPVLVEAVPSPTDVVGGLVGGPGATIPGVTKDRFNVNVVIENNDMLFEIRSDSMVNLSAIPLWFQGSNNLNGKGVPSPNFNGLFTFQPPRIQFVQVGLPRKMANNYGFEFASRINPNSSMAMGFVDQQTNAAGPAAITTFVGNSSAKLTNATIGSYFDNGSIAHFSHDIEDLYQFYSTPGQDPRHPDGETFTERCQYMFRSNQLGTPNGIPAAGNTDQFANGGGPAFINNVFQGTDSAMLEAQDSAGLFTPSNATKSATFTGEGRIGHIDGLQRLSRAPDSTPLHIRNDGPGLDGMDVPAFRTFPTNVGSDMPAGSAQFKLQFLIYVPTADFFASMRSLQASQDLQKQFTNVNPDDNGLERFITATRRQNFLVPPRRHRAFPLLELT
ncbi:MAG: hypothetical protein QOJ73_5619 [Streptosporangiaceae bacterium]|jgi:hypothetical protein|nr:hypothetical protein [Streptosporangiaceae bacterium]